MLDNFIRFDYTLKIVLFVISAIFTFISWITKCFIGKNNKRGKKWKIK